jgi:hypothetical protein
VVLAESEEVESHLVSEPDSLYQVGDCLSLEAKEPACAESPVQGLHLDARRMGR